MTGRMRRIRPVPLSAATRPACAPGMLRQRPARLPLHPRQQSREASAGADSHLPPPEPARHQRERIIKPGFRPARLNIIYPGQHGHQPGNRKGIRMSPHLPEIRLRPVTEADLGMFRRFAVEPGLIGLDWSGFRDPKAVQRRFDTDSYLGEDNGRLIVDVAAGAEPGREPAGLVSYQRRYHGTQAFCWEIGIALLPEWRGRGIGWRAQAIFCSYLFENTPVQRIEAATHAENASEQRSLEKAGFTLEGVISAADFRTGQWRDGYLYSRLRTDPDPLAD